MTSSTTIILASLTPIGNGPGDAADRRTALPVSQPGHATAFISGGPPSPSQVPPPSQNAPTEPQHQSTRSTVIALPSTALVKTILTRTCKALVAFAGLAAAYLALCLAVWTSWKDFREDCRGQKTSGGFLSPECKEALSHALRAPPMVKWMSGSAKVKRDALGFRTWSPSSVMYGLNGNTGTDKRAFVALGLALALGGLVIIIHRRRMSVGPIPSTWVAAPIPRMPDRKMQGMLDCIEPHWKPTKLLPLLFETSLGGDDVQSSWHPAGISADIAQQEAVIFDYPFFTQPNNSQTSEESGRSERFDVESDIGSNVSVSDSVKPAGVSSGVSHSSDGASENSVRSGLSEKRPTPNKAWSYSDSDTETLSKESSLDTQFEFDDQILNSRAYRKISLDYFRDNFQASASSQRSMAAPWSDYQK